MKSKKKMLIIFMMIIGVISMIIFMEKNMFTSNSKIVQLTFTNDDVTETSVSIHVNAQCLDGYEIKAMQVDEQPKAENINELNFTVTENRDYRVKVYYQSLTEQKELTETFTTTIDSIKESNNDVSLFTDSRTISENGFTIVTDEAKQEAAITAYTGSAKELEIPEVIAGYKITIIYNNAFSGKNLISVKIPDSVTSIGESAFAGCTSLKSIKIPDSVTSIGERAFAGCTSLKSIKIPDSVTRIGYYAFQGCTSLESIEIPDSVTSMEIGSFFGCEKLSTVKLSKSLSETGHYTFKGCINLENVVIPEGITTIGAGSFEGCMNLKSIELPKTVTIIQGSAFLGCSSLKKINLENIEKIFLNAFYGTGLESFIFLKAQLINLISGVLPVSGQSLKFLAVPLNQAIKYKIKNSPQLNDIMIMCTDPNQYNLPDDAKILEIETTNLDVRWYRAVLTGDIYVKQNRIYSAYSKGRKINLYSIFENKGIKEVLYQGKSGTELYTGDSVSIPQDFLELDEETDISMKYQLIGNPTSSDTKIIDNKLYIGADETSSDLKVTANILSTTKEVPITVVPIDSIAIKNEPQNTYINGEIYNPKGLVITVTYDDGYQEDVIYNDETKNDFLFAYNQFDLSNTKQIIEYMGKTIEHKLTILPRYIDMTIKSIDTSVTITGKLTRGSYLIVEKREESQEKFKDKMMIGNYEVKVIGKYQGKLFIVFDVGDENNGKKAYIRHLKQDGTIDEYEETVLAGKVGITVSELSPFVIYIDKEKIDINYQDEENNVIPVIKGPLVETKNENQQNTIVTGDRETIIPYITTLGIGILGIGYYLFKRKQRE